jgi:alpha-1,6-mannosyltransferase
VLLGLVVVADIGLLLSPYRSSADRTAPLALGACAAVIVLVVAERRSPGLPPKLVASCAVGLLVLAVWFPPRTSHDLWSYAMYGRIVAAHDRDPYVVPPADFPHDPALQRVSFGWRDTPSVYGPAFIAASAGLAKVVGTNGLATRVAYQGAAALAIGAVLVLLYRRNRTAALIAVGLHPIVVVDLVNGGHNDAWVGVLLLASVLAVERGWFRWAGAAASVAALVKIVAILPAGALVFWLWRRRGPKAAVQAAVTSAVVLVGAYALAGGQTALAPVHAAAANVSRVSVWLLLDLERHGDRETLMLLVLVGVPAAVAAFTRVRSHPSAAVAAAAMPFLLAAPYILPWYFAWVMPLVALADDGVLAAVLLADTTLVAMAYRGRFELHPDLLDQFLRSELVVTRGFELVALALLVVAGAVSLRAHRPRPAAP